MAHPDRISAQTGDDINTLIDYTEDATNVVSALIDAAQLPLQSTTIVPPALPPVSTDVQPFEIHVLPEVISLGDQPSDATQRQYAASGLYIKKKYRIHLGTLPGFYQSELFTYEQCQWRHDQLINLLSQFRVKLEDSGLKNFQFDIILSNGIYTTEVCGIQRYAAIIFDSCERVTVEGVAAIIGRIFRQKAIRIFDENADYRDDPIGMTSDEGYYVHRFFAISRLGASSDLSISNDDARKMMAAIREVHPDLSGQFGHSRETIELHDFGDNYNTEIIDSLQEIVKDTFKGQNQSYRIEERRARSRLLAENEYKEAIKQAGFELLALIIETARLPDT